LRSSRFEHVIETVRRVVVVVCAVIAVVVVSPAAAVEPVFGGCAWVPDLLPLPDNTFDGMVTAGDGAWLAGNGYDPDEGLLWHEGRLVAHDSAFGLPTKLTGVNADGVAVGYVTGPDGRRHAVRRVARRYEFLGETAGRSTVWDVNSRGDAVGYDGVALVVWPLAGPARVLAMPDGAGPYGNPVIDDDGSVVVRTGRLVGGAMRWQAYVWTADGTRAASPVDEVRDVRDGQTVGTLGSPETMAVAAGWGRDGRPRVYAGGVAAVAVNRAGVVVGAGPAGEPLVWTGGGPTRLPAPGGYHDGSVNAINDRDAAGFVAPADDEGTVPIRWFCR
jgi:hypothetical protein